MSCMCPGFKLADTCIHGILYIMVLNCIPLIIFVIVISLTHAWKETYAAKLMQQLHSMLLTSRPVYA